DAHHSSRVGGGWCRERNLPTAEPHGAGIRLNHARDDLDERRLAGPVLAEHRMDPAALASEVDSLERTDAAITLGNARESQEGFGRGYGHGQASARDGLASARSSLVTVGPDHCVFFSLCAMISGAVKVTSQGRNWFGAKKLALRSGQ